MWKQPSTFLAVDISARGTIDIGVPGPHSVFLPCGDSHYFTDFAWIARRLVNLFDEVAVADQNFKGFALEEYVRSGKSELPVRQCNAADGTRNRWTLCLG
jgi:hypothetical protein